MDVINKDPDAYNASPIKDSSKINFTPRRLRRKARKFEKRSDVHTPANSTPISASSSQVSFKSPISSPSVPCSQEICPDVVWDYSSPKLENGSKKKELKLSITEFLEKLNCSQVPEQNTQSKQMKLLENWIHENKSMQFCINNNQHRKVKRKPSRQTVEELKMFFNDLQKLSTEINVNQTNQSANENSKSTNGQARLNISKDFLAQNSTDSDSMDELWGDLDNSFMVKATQELESCSSLPSNSAEVVSTIPETNANTYDAEFELPQNEFVTRDQLSDKCIELLTQFEGINWDSDMESDEWENGFVAESLPTFSSEQIDTPNEITPLYDKNLPDDKRNVEKKKFDTDVNGTPGTGGLDYAAFEDDTLFMEPDVLTQINEIESQFSQQSRCSPEEIKRKKQEALQKRKKKNLK